MDALCAYRRQAYYSLTTLASIIVMKGLLSSFESIKYALLPKKIYLRYQVARSSQRFEKELGMLRFLVREGCNAIDGGAHKGVYSYALSSICEQVHAFEPNPAMYEYLRKAVPGNVKTYQMALSDYSGSASFKVPRSGAKTHNTRGSLQDVSGETGAHIFETKVVDLDSLCLENIGFIKLDVEGNEYAAIRGAEQLIKKNRPVILVELTGVAGNLPQLVVDLLEEWGYAPVIPIDGRLRYFGESTSTNIRQNCLFLPIES